MIEEEHKCTIFYYCKLDDADRILLCSQCQKITLMSTIEVESRKYNLTEYSDDVIKDSI